MPAQRVTEYSRKQHQLDIRSKHHRWKSDPALPQPLFLILDALLIMLLDRYLLWIGVLQGDRPLAFSERVALVGFDPIGTLQRAALYSFVTLGWLTQTSFSLWWLAQFRFAPAE